MLELIGIKKDYPAGSGVVHALKGVDVKFRRSEFVAILGPSGCGKTTMLNIIGGLDGYTDGDLIINGVSTKEYNDRDWDTYRNHSVGFVFQSYNLIPHQTVLQNVELALTLSGVSKAERRERAAKALAQVGLGDQLNKKPGEMSGGQMQRVAIARALVNDPDIILADEPTGALDTETSVQVMEILKEISRERLIVMVTHNPELADEYATRIIRMLDGELIHDSAPLSDDEVNAENAFSKELTKQEAANGKRKKPSMSFFTAFMLSLKNLFTKKGRTVLTSFAGSIGIIGIALILAVSQGMTGFINHVQENTLSTYPLTLESQTVDMSALMRAFLTSGSDVTHDKDAIYKDPIIADLVNALREIEANEHDLAAFKLFIESELAKEDSEFKNALSGVQYTYALTPMIYTKNQDGKIIKSDTGVLMMEMLRDFFIQIGANGGNSEGDSENNTSSGMGSSLSSSMMGTQMWQELLPGLEKGDPINDLLEEQYDVIYGSWPNSANEIVLVLNEKNELDDLTLYALGLLSKEEIDKIITAAASGETLPDDGRKWSYEEICELSFKTVLPYDCYKQMGDIYVDYTKFDDVFLEQLYNEAFELKVVGIIRPNEDAEATMLSGSIGYTHMLTEHIIKGAENSDVVKAQKASPDVDILTGLPFKANTGRLTAQQKKNEFISYVKGISKLDEKAKVYIDIQCIKMEELQLEAGVEMAFKRPEMQNKDALIAMISASLAEQMGVDPSMVAEQLSELELSELHAMMRPAIEEQVKAGIRSTVETMYATVPNEQLAAMLDAEIAKEDGYTDDQYAKFYDEITVFSDSTYEQNLITIGSVELSSPATINLYASSFENKDIITATIDNYNASVGEAQKIAYTDFLGIMMSSITTIINAISYVLIAFVSISLVVSSIMIGVITLISVQERTKEIGILRAIGASKRDVSSMFNAETMIIGLASGVFGIGVTYLLCIPINLILHALTGLGNLKAVLPIPAALILIGISVLLTLIAGIIPSRSAAKKDPVVALRSE